MMVLRLRFAHVFEEEFPTVPHFVDGYVNSCK